MKPPNLYSVFAVILPVSLGLGIVYLSIMGRIDTASAILITVGLMAVIGAAIFLRDFAADEKAEELKRR